MSYRPPSVPVGDRITASLASGMGLVERGSSSVDPAMFDVAREFAFASDDPAEFAVWYLRNQCLSKFREDDKTSDLQRKQKAKASFLQSEEICRASNARLVDAWNRASLDLAVWKRARSIISSVLGRFPLEKLPVACGFGPGASSGLRRKTSSQQNKWVLSTHITEGAIPYYAAFRSWAGLPDLTAHLLVVAGNRVTTVPKSYKTDRTIAIEPDWNMFFQKGVGNLIRQRLQRVGLLHPDAQEYHQALARLGSWTGHLATLDLSAASDSISLALCEALLPEDWFKVICDLRSPRGDYDGESILYEKVSSMGNGFTFELETLLFYGLVAAVCNKEDRYNVTVYGDDIIVPTQYARRAVSILKEAGFSTNDDKSFIDGPFRESCGGHYFRGVDVSPFYHKEQCSTVGDLVVLGNQLQEWAARFPMHAHMLRPAFRLVKREVPRALYGPWGLAGCLWRDWDESTPRWSYDHQSYSQRVVVRQHKYADLVSYLGSYIYKLWKKDDAETSYLPTVMTTERYAVVSCDRDHWKMLPVRLS